MPDVLVEREGPVMILRLNRPERRNALGGTMAGDLLRAFEEAKHDDSVHVVVTTGEGDTFCVGADRAELAELEDLDTQPAHDRLNDESIGGDRGHPVPSPEQRRIETMGIGRWFMRMWELEKPTIAALNGATAGGGLAIALMHDFRIGSVTAKYTTAFIHLGVTPEMGMSLLLTRAVGYQAAADLVLRGRTITGDEAASIGLIDRAVDADQVFDSAMELANELAQLPPLALQLTKRALRAAGNVSVEEQLRLEYQNQLFAFNSGEPQAAADRLRATSGQSTNGA